MSSNTEIGLRAEIHELREMIGCYEAMKRGVAIRIADLEDKAEQRLRESEARGTEIAGRLLRLQNALIEALRKEN